MKNSVCLPDTEYKINDSGKHFSILENGSTSSTESTSFLKIKRKLNPFKENIHWSLEEEYIFFFVYSFIKNKWTNYALLFPQLPKQMKEIKNHFHSCIIKTVRRIMNNKFDNSVKNIMRSVYSCFYLLTLESKSQSQKVKNNNKRHKYNPKNLFLSKQLTKEMIIKYYDIFMTMLAFGLIFMAFWHAYPFFGDRFAAPMWSSLIFLLPGACLLYENKIYKLCCGWIVLLIAIKVFSSNLAMLGLDI